MTNRSETTFTKWVMTLFTAILIGLLTWIGSTTQTSATEIAIVRDRMDNFIGETYLNLVHEFRTLNRDHRELERSHRDLINKVQELEKKYGYQ